MRFVSTSSSLSQLLTRFIALIFAIVEFWVKILKLFVWEKKTKSSRFSFAHSLINPKQCYIIISFLHVSVADFNNLCRSLSPFFPCVGIFMDFFVTFFISILILLRTHWNHILIVAFSRLVSSLPSNFSCSQSIWAYLNGRIFLPSIESIPIAEP